MGGKNPRPILVKAADMMIARRADTRARADFATWKNVLIAGFAAVGIGTCIFVQDFLAVRGLAVVFLLLAKLMVDTGRPFLAKTPWVLLFQVFEFILTSPCR